MLTVVQQRLRGTAAWPGPARLSLAGGTGHGTHGGPLHHTRAALGQAAGRGRRQGARPLPGQRVPAGSLGKRSEGGPGQPLRGGRGDSGAVTLEEGWAGYGLRCYWLRLTATVRLYQGALVNWLDTAERTALYLPLASS